MSLTIAGIKGECCVGDMTIYFSWKQLFVWLIITKVFPSSFSGIVSEKN